MNYTTINRYTALIDLRQSEDELWKNLKGETRSQIRQGQRFGLEAVETTNREGLEAFYKCVRSVADRTAMKLPPKLFFDVLFEILVPAKMARIYAVRKEGETLGSALFLYYKGTLVARYWAAFQDTLKLRPYHVLIWHVLTEAKRMGYHTCDFGGMPPDQANGIYKFKKGWGVQIEHVDWYVKPVGLGRAIASAKKALSLFTRNSGAPT
jgi:lipid II:glycine glycyltransferase (peptidoglycan interpeptide bridge formation enzyme)